MLLGWVAGSVCSEKLSPNAQKMLFAEGRVQSAVADLDQADPLPLQGFGNLHALLDTEAVAGFHLVTAAQLDHNRKVFIHQVFSGKEAVF